MKTFYALFTVVLLGTSISAMAEDGGDHVMQRIEEQRAIAMEHYQDEHQSRTEVVSVPAQNAATSSEQPHAAAQVSDSRG